MPRVRGTRGTDVIFKTVPVIVKDEVQLLDMYVDGEWHGSRRTQQQCDDHFFHVIWVEEMIGTRGEHEYNQLLKVGVGSRTYREFEARGKLHVINGWIA